MKTFFTAERIFQKRATSWLLVSLVCVVCNVFATATAKGATVRDEFDAISYSGNNGTINWTNDWQEAGDADTTPGPADGFLSVQTSGSCTAANCMRIGDDSGSQQNRVRWLWREADTSGATTLLFTYDVETLLADRGWVDVEIRVGGGSWDPLTAYDMNSGDVDTCGAFDISAYIGSDTQIRFWATNRDHDPGTLEDFRGEFYFDNIELLTDAAQTSCTDVGVTKTDSADPVTTSTSFTYNLTVTNNGAPSGTNVSLVDTLPAGTTFQTATPSQGSCVESGGVVTCSLGTIAGGANATVAIVVTSPSTVPDIVKRAFWADGTPIPTGVDIPSGIEFKYLLYINNTVGLINNSATVSMDQGDSNANNNTANETTKIISGAITDVSVRDILDPAFLYQTPSIRVDNSVLACALATCNPGEEAAIFTAVDGATVLSDATGDDVVSYSALTVDAGDENVANLQLDIGGNAVWAILFSVKMP